MAKKNVFDNELMERLTIEWKKSRDANTYQAVCMGCLNLIEAIIRSNGFHRQVAFSDVRNEIFVMLFNFLDKWQADRGFKLYSYLSQCIKHACISIVKQDALLRKRHVFTDIELDVLGDDHDVSYTHIEYTKDDINHLREKTKELQARWREPIIRESLQFLVECVITNRAYRRAEILRSLTFGYKIPNPTAKFLLDWAIAAVRIELMDHYDTPLGEVDILRAAEKYSYIPDMLNIIGFQNVQKLLKVFAGMSVKFPSLSAIKKCLATRALINSKNYTPDSVAAVARSFNLSPEKLQESFESISENITAGVLDDNPLFDEDEGEGRQLEERYLKEQSWDRITDIPDFAKDFGMTEDDISSLYSDKD